VTRGVPARAIVVGLDPEAQTDALEGNTTAVCGVGDLAGVCSERVRLRARGGVCARVASAVAALREPEMPTALVWLGRVHTDDEVFLALASDVQRVVLDTEYTSLASLLHLSRWANAAPGRPHIADLAWTRLALWQEMCARFFDAPDLTPLATHVTRIVLEQSSESGARLGSEGALLLGWLGTRLGWKFSRVGGHVRFVRPDGGFVAVHLGSVAPRIGVAPDELVAIAIEAEAGGVKLKGRVARERPAGDPADVLVWRLESAAPCATEQRVRLRANRGAPLLERTLHRPARDPALVDAVAFAEELVEDGVTVA
jgi:glucose-6-phosphate dehydrogenase assembly protein OpcA